MTPTTTWTIRRVRFAELSVTKITKCRSIWKNIQHFCAQAVNGIQRRTTCAIEIIERTKVNDRWQININNCEFSVFFLLLLSA
jgi:hypothetical protein